MATSNADMSRVTGSPEFGELSKEEYIQWMKNANADFFNNRKRVRRTKGEISRAFVCSEEDCRKSYGSEGALKMHTRLKHESKKSKHSNRTTFRPLIPNLSCLSINTAFKGPNSLVEGFEVNNRGQIANWAQNGGSNNLNRFEDFERSALASEYLFEDHVFPTVNGEGTFYCKIMKVQCGSWQNMSTTLGDMYIEFRPLTYAKRRTYEANREDEYLNIILHDPTPFKLKIPTRSILAYNSEDLQNGFEIFAIELSSPPTFFVLNNISVEDFSPSSNYSEDSFVNDTLIGDCEREADLQINDHTINNDESGYIADWIEIADFSGGNIRDHRIILMRITKNSSCSLLAQFTMDPYLSIIYHSPLTHTELFKVKNNIYRNEALLLNQKHSVQTTSPSPPSPSFSSTSFSTSPAKQIETNLSLSQIRQNFLENASNAVAYPTKKDQFDFESEFFVGDTVLAESIVTTESINSKRREKLENITSLYNISIKDFSDCAIQNLISSIDDGVDFEALISLPCLHFSVPLCTLFTHTTCFSCSLSWYYSFCLQTVVSSAHHNHCTLCNKCTNTEAHNCLLLL